MSVTNARATLNQSFGSLQLQVLFDRGISNRHVNQSSILKPRDELIVFDRIEGDATGAPPEHAIIFGAKSGGGVPVRVDDPFERRSVADVAVVRGDAIEHHNDLGVVVAPLDSTAGISVCCVHAESTDAVAPAQ
jgi:hypothetical protein